MLKIFLVIFAILVIFCLWVMVYDTHNFVVRKYQFRSPLIKKDIRLVMISDLHNYRYGNENEMLLAAIEKQSPDVVVLAGDMITAKYGDKFGSTLTLIEKLMEKYPLYYAYGNHEQKLHSLSKCKEMAKEFDEELKERKIHPFLNEQVYLEEYNISLYGLYVDHSYFKRFSKEPMEEGYIESLVGKADKAHYNVLLAHNPEYFPEYAAWGADLTLSGHIHGGIARIPFWKGVISPAIKLFPKYDGGHFHEFDKDMVIGRGIGTHAPKVRLFNPAELVVVELKADC